MLSAPRGKSLFRRRTIKLDGQPTSMSLEGAFWDALREIAAAQGTTLKQLLASINSERRQRQQRNFSSVIRVFILDYYRRRLES
jgi:predicted DNA-binding ribbon-helix-helix protein